ncbi:hypothetical protein EDC94DRAFT_582640 [Helicostylum pulchrum]|nr:hypothetical protein EDC94DRAFT_582640 [Helicostylum pulchrum]
MAAKRQKLLVYKSDDEEEQEEKENDNEEEEEEEEDEDVDESYLLHHHHHQQQQKQADEYQEQNGKDDINPLFNLLLIKTLNEEHLTAVLESLNPDDSFDSLEYQGDCSSSLKYLDCSGISNGILQTLTLLLTLSFIFLFGHSLTKLPRLCQYLNIKDCSTICEQIEVPDITNYQDVLRDLSQPQKAFFKNLHNPDNFTYTCHCAPGLANLKKESRFSEQAVFPIVLPLFSRCRDYEVSKYDKSTLSMKNYKPDLLVLLKCKFDFKCGFFYL